jgi:hypothetical protein
VVGVEEEVVLHQQSLKLHPAIAVLRVGEVGEADGLAVEEAHQHPLCS